MRINIYQIDSDKDNNRVKFDSYRRTLENGGINQEKPRTESGRSEAVAP